jgi:LuxR family transcriptional regulator, maltose regulon positive regulatory protein
MHKADPLLRTKLRMPFTRPKLVTRARLQEQVTQGLRSPLTLITAPAGFGKTTLAAACVTGCGLTVAWLSLDKDDNREGRFRHYLLASLQEADRTIGIEAEQLITESPQAPAEAVLTSLINDLDSAGKEIVLVLDDYQFISNPAVHEQVAFLLEHCPQTLHLVIATRSDPPLPLARLLARGQTVELRTADLRFTEPETTQFLNEVMGLDLDAGSVAVLAERTEGWIVGLQMAALSLHNRKDALGFIEGFSGTNRYILDYLLEEVLASQPPQIQHFLLYTSILDRLSAPLCDAVLASGEGSKSEGDDRLSQTVGDQRPELLFLSHSASILEYLDRSNVFLVPLDDERIWYRYHHLFADLLRTQLHKSLSAQGVAQLHVRASEWHGQNGSVLEAIIHASIASDDERVERLIEQNYMEMVNRGELSWMRSWTDKLSKELVYRRPWLCIYEALSHSWFGELDEADLLLEKAEARIQSETPASDTRKMMGHLAYVKSRVTAMRGDIQRAIELILAAREYFHADDLAMQLDTGITLGYEYFMEGDYANASQVLNETIRSGASADSIINTVAASCIMARLYAIQGLLNKSYEHYLATEQFIPDISGHHLGARALVKIGMADVLCEWNDQKAALAHVKQGLAWLPFWGKADDFVLAYVTLARIQLAQANRGHAIEAVEKAIKIIQTTGLFSEARSAAETAQVKLWLLQGDWTAVDRWAAKLEKRYGSHDQFRFEDEQAHINRSRVYIAQNKPAEAIHLLSQLEGTARSVGRMGRVIEILLLEALALQKKGDPEHAFLALTKCLGLAEPGGYVRIFLDEGQPMQMLLAQWLSHKHHHGGGHANAAPMRDHSSFLDYDILRYYVLRLLSQFKAEPQAVTSAQAQISPTGDLLEPLSQRELEVLQLIALGGTNQEIARQLIVSPGTVKAHTSSIYRKLDVANRTEAVAHARQLGILT